MNWHVFKRGDPSTYPEIDCPMYVCWTNGDRYRFYDARWDNEDKHFMRDLRWIVFEQGDIFYAYVGYIPCIEKECHPAKCKGDKYLCGDYDDGYCLGDDRQCKCMEVVTEYSLGYKRIWKDFS